MMELTINDKTYAFHFGIRFLKAANKKHSIKQDTEMGEIVTHLGVRLAYGSLYDHDVEALEEILLMANDGQTPRITANELEAYIDDEATDIDQLFDEVMDFLLTSNACKKEALTAKEQIEAAQKAQELVSIEDQIKAAREELTELKKKKK